MLDSYSVWNVPFGIAAYTFIPAAFLKIAVYHHNYEILHLMKNMPLNIST